jgi:hypothetical protein
MSAASAGAASILHRAPVVDLRGTRGGTRVGLIVELPTTEEFQ